MSIPAADILASLSSAPSGKTVRTARVADSPRTGGTHKGFSSVLQRVRDIEEKGELHKSEKTSSPSRSDDKSPVKEAKGVDNDVRSRGNEARGKDVAGTETEHSKSVSQSAKRNKQAGESTNNDDARTRAEQSDSSSSRIVKTNEGEINEDKSTEVLGTSVDSSVNNGVAPLGSDAQGQASLFMTTLFAASTNSQPVDLKQGADEGDLEEFRETPQTEDGSTDSVFVTSKAPISSSGKLQNGEDHAPVANTAGTLQTQQQPIVSRSMADSEQGTPINVVSESPRPSDIQDPSRSNKMVEQDPSMDQSRRDTGSLAMKTDSLELTDVKVALEPVRKDQVIENPKGEATQKVTGQSFGHPLLSSAQERPSGIQEHDTSVVKNTSLSQQGPQPIISHSGDFREMWAGQHDGKQDQGGGKLFQTAASDQQILNGQRAESFAVGAQGASAPAAGSLSHGGTALSHAPSAQLAHTTAPLPLPLSMKSVVFDVIQPDLGHVNVRVAMTNDVVHAHLSTDRQEVGQSLISGQDRLQSSLQASGLDMGQFRVDIDRQGTGRSFQQGFSQDQQGRAWNQDSQWTDGERVTYRYDEAHAPLQRRLNVVA